MSKPSIRLRLESYEERIVPAFPVAVDDSFSAAPQQLTDLDVLANDPFRQQLTISGFTPPPANTGQLVQTDTGFRFFANADFNGTTFTYTVAPATPEQSLSTPDAQTNDALGLRSALSSDGNWLALASPLASFNGLQLVGKVAVFERIATGWALRQVIVPPDIVNGGIQFGSTLAFDSTGSTLIVGAPSTDLPDEPDSGQVIVFRRNGSVFQEQQRIRAAVPQLNGLFGVYLSLTPDGSTLAVGEGGANSNTGRVHIYTLEQFVYRPRQVITASDGAIQDLFGTVSLSGDGQTLIVGAPGADVGGVTDAGKAYLFTRSGNTFTQQAIILPPSPVTSGVMGQDPIAINQDGSVIAIPARLPQTVYVFNRSGTTINPVQTIALPVSGDARIGVNVTLTADGNQLFIGQPSATVNNLTNAGQVLRYSRSGSTFTQQEVLTADDAAANAGFGSSPLVTPDGNTLIVGASGATVNDLANAGKGYVIERGTSSATVTLTRGTIVPGGPQLASRGQRLLQVSGTPNAVAEEYRFLSDGAINSVSGPFEAFPGYAGVVQATAGDINGDGVADRIYATGPGNSLLRVLSGVDGAELVPAFATYEAGFTGGIFLAAHDIDGDGRAEIAVSPDVGGGGRVQIFAFDNGQLVLRDNFFGIEDQTFRGGARIALGDINGDGRAELIVGAGFGGGPRIAIFDGTGLLQGQSAPPKLVGDFFAFPGADAVSLRNGVFVSAGDLNADGKADLVFGGGPGGGPRVFVLNGATFLSNIEESQNNPLANFFVAGNVDARGGVRVAVKDVNDDLFLDLVVASGEGQPAEVRTYLGDALRSDAEPALFGQLVPFGNAVISGGVYVG